MKICKSEDLSLEISVIEGKVLFSAQCPILFLYYIMIIIPLPRLKMKCLCWASKSLNIHTNYGNDELKKIYYCIRSKFHWKFLFYFQLYEHDAVGAGYDGAHPGLRLQPEQGDVQLYLDRPQSLAGLHLHSLGRGTTNANA